VRGIAAVVGPRAFAEAVHDLKPLLPARDRSLAFLELAACLPPALHGALARAFGAARFRAAHGCALDDCYATYPLPKKSGGTRTITVPPVWLRLLQRGVYEQILRPLGAHDAAHGFVPDRSIMSNATPHVGHAVVVNCDIANCFPSVRWSLVLAALKRDLGERFAPATISWLVDLSCYRGGLPVGAPTSPALLNRVLVRTDTFLAEHARRRECRYTRYADDLTFSGDARAVGLLRLAATSLARIGLELDQKKTNIYRGGRRQIVTGLVVNRQVSVPRRLRRRLRAAVHAVEQGRAPSWHGEPTTLSSLRGRLAFTQAINRAEAERLVRRLEAAESK
jgi:retron-type reverse transcriptase